ncbi:response regulator [Leptolyngbya sp. NK1-12]|uniref:Response regulator n=1 Tax=Leptolyngbya sp. NK1-12 TaxID=2547451 RepID=A0AA96WFD9_9CYAN|nr:response regulator [Leptolyngbya sp. NK1-12]
MRILLVEDDESIVELVTAILNEQKYVVDVATDGEAGWELIEAFPYDLVLLDIGLPKLDGIALCRRLRSQKKQVLVMLLTAQDTTTDKLLGLDAGADDYVVKPFDVRELAARIRALLRRGSTSTTPVLTCGNLHLDPSACEVTYNGQLLRFSRKEYLLLELFLRHQHRVFSRSAIVDQIWSFSEDPPNEDTVKSHIKSIRRKLDAVGAGDLIETLYGQGYRINPAYLADFSDHKSDHKAVAQASEQAVQESTPRPQQALNHSVTAIWQRTKGVNLERVQRLDQAVQMLRLGSLSPDLQQQAIQNAHKLAGSLGTFGFEEGSQLAQQLENLLEAGIPQWLPTAQKRAVTRVEPLVLALKQLLEAEVISPESAVAEPVTPVVAASQIQPLLLIWERDQDLIEAITAQAPTYQLRTTVATTLAMAQHQCQQERPAVALIDFSLLRTATPDQSRQGLLAELQKPPAVPIVLLSTEDSSKARVEAVHVGGQLFLKKPIQPATILQAIGDLVSTPPVQRPKVLLVDDDPLVAQILSSCLEPQGIQLMSLQDPTQFWETLKQVHPDLLILDVNMPTI